MNFPKATFSCKSNERSFSKFTNISGEINSMTANLVEIESFDLPSVVKQKKEKLVEKSMFWLRLPYFSLLASRKRKKKVLKRDEELLYI